MFTEHNISIILFPGWISYVQGISMILSSYEAATSSSLSWLMEAAKQFYMLWLHLVIPHYILYYIIHLHTYCNNIMKCIHKVHDIVPHCWGPSCRYSVWCRNLHRRISRSHSWASESPDSMCRCIVRKNGCIYTMHVNFIYTAAWEHLVSNLLSILYMIV